MGWLSRIRGTANALKNLDLGSKEIEAYPVVVVGSIDDSGEMANQGGTVDAKQSGTWTVAQASTARKRGSGGVDNANGTGAGANLNVDVDLGAAREITDIFISAHNAGGTPIQIDVPVLLIAGQAASPTDQLIELAPPVDFSQQHFKCDIHAQIIRAEFMAATSGTVYELGVSYWGL